MSRPYSPIPFSRLRLRSSFSAIVLSAPVGTCWTGAFSRLYGRPICPILKTPLDSHHVPAKRFPLDVVPQEKTALIDGGTVHTLCIAKRSNQHAAHSTMATTKPLPGLCSKGDGRGPCRLRGSPSKRCCVLSPGRTISIPTRITREPIAGNAATKTSRQSDFERHLHAPK